MTPMTELKPAKGWTELSPARLAVPPPAERGWIFRALSRIAGRFGRSELPDIFTVLHIHPRLFWPWLFFASRLMPYGRLPARIRELAILRTAWNCRSRYEWGQHVEMGLSVGLGADDILGVSRGPAAFPEHSPERAVLQACDDLCAHQCISEDSWQRLSTHYHPKHLIEIMMLVGHYVMVAGFLNSAGLVLEPSLERGLRRFHRGLATAATPATADRPRS